MVDLRDVLRPFVDEAAAGPRRPVAEVAERAAQARRRRVRRRSAGAGLAAVVVAGGLALVGSFTTPDRSSQVSVADTSRPATTDATSVPLPRSTTSTSTTPTTAAPTTAVPSTSAPASTVGTLPSGDQEPLVSLVDGVVATSTTTSSWDSGHCIEIRVENTTTSPVEWKVRSALDGTIATLWSAVADDQGGGIVVFTGEEGYNRQLAAGASTTFGTCVDTP